MISQYQDMHFGQDIWVLGSGKTLDFYDPAMFEGRVVVGTNYGWTNLLESVDYMVTKYHKHANDWVGSERVGVVVTTRGERGHRNLEPIDDPRMVIADHNENTVERWTDQEWPTDPEALVATHSTITTALHWAAHIGARTIFLAGADCGTIDGDIHIDGYKINQTNQDMLRNYDLQNRMVRDKIWQIYRTPIVTVLPFVTPNMDGHTFRSHAGALNAS